MSSRILRKVSKKFFITVNIVTAVLFLLACCSSFLDPGKYWFIAILGVGFPFIILLLLLFIFFWWFFKSRWLFLPLGLLLLGWFQVNVVFAFHLFTSFEEKKPAHSLRVMQWNVARLGQMNKKKSADYSRSEIFKFIQEMNPDVLCMEEFLESNKPKEMEENIPYISKTLNYPYYFFARDHKRRDKLYEHGVIIFSRYPILDTLRIRYESPDMQVLGESLIHADIDVNGPRIRIFATHLQSLKFESEDYFVLEKIAKVEDSAVSRSKGVLKKFRTAYGLRKSQADLVRKEMDNSPYPPIICGDFNDIPNSYTYFKIKGGRNDAFLKKGFGIGRTFTSLSPTLRIDYILADKRLETLQCKKWRVFYSDHFPLVADFKLPGKD
jgi:endonuclease/exonuclease/phosphatase family metal-dependent hydrolase